MKIKRLLSVFLLCVCLSVLLAIPAQAADAPDIRAKAARLREHTEDIFAWVKLHPECADDARRFCSYYLPTAVKLLNTYNEVAPHADESSVAAGIQSEVSQVLDTMSTAFRGLMDNLLQNTAVDMQAEISALETVLAHYQGPLVLDAEEFIAVKGFKAKGKRISTFDIETINELDPVRFAPVPQPQEGNEGDEEEADFLAGGLPRQGSNSDIIDEITGQMKLFDE